MYYTPDTLDMCVDFGYDDAVSMETHGVKPDNIFSSLDKWLPKGGGLRGSECEVECLCAGYYRSLDTFSIALASQSTFTPPGQQLHSYSRQDDASYLIFKVRCSPPLLFPLSPSSLPGKAGLSDRGMKSYLSRLQPLLLWFIEAASYIGQCSCVFMPQYRTHPHSVLNDSHIVCCPQMKRMASGCSIWC